MWKTIQKSTNGKKNENFSFGGKSLTEIRNWQLRTGAQFEAVISLAQNKRFKNGASCGTVRTQAAFIPLLARCIVLADQSMCDEMVVL